MFGGKNSDIGLFHLTRVVIKNLWLKTKAKLGAKAMARSALERNEGYELRDPQNSYNHVFAPGKCSLRLKNEPVWQISSYNTKT